MTDTANGWSRGVILGFRLFGTLLVLDGAVLPVLLLVVLGLGIRTPSDP